MAFILIQPITIAQIVWASPGQGLAHGYSLFEAYEQGKNNGYVLLTGLCLNSKAPLS